MSPKTILLVDDNQDDLDLTLRALRKSKIGNQVVVTRDGVDALITCSARAAIWAGIPAFSRRSFCWI